MKSAYLSPGKMYRWLIPAVLGIMPAFTVPQEDIQVVWGSKTITWDDFKGPHNPKSAGIASTFSYMDMDILPAKTKTTVTVALRAVFDREESWVIYKENSVLNHERGHFDITELYARKLRKKISETVFDAKRYETELWKLYKTYDRLMDQYHDRYDEETDSSMDTPQQKAWEASIRKDIAALNAYKNTTVPLRLGP